MWTSYINIYSGACSKHSFHCLVHDLCGRHSTAWLKYIDREREWITANNTWFLDIEPCFSGRCGTRHTQNWLTILWQHTVLYTACYSYQPIKTTFKFSYHNWNNSTMQVIKTIQNLFKVVWKWTDEDVASQLSKCHHGRLAYTHTCTCWSSTATCIFIWWIKRGTAYQNCWGCTYTHLVKLIDSDTRIPLSYKLLKCCSPLNCKQ